MNRLNRRILSGIFALLIFTVSCGGFIALINTARAVTAGSAPVLSRLVARGVITEAQKNVIRGFLDGTSSNLTATQAEWTAAGNDRVKQVAAVQASVNREASLVAGLTNLPPEARMIIDDVNAVFQIIAAFYGVNLPPAMRPPPVAPMIAKPASDSELQKQLKARIAALKQRLQ